MMQIGAAGAKRGDVRIGEDSPIMTGQYFAVDHAFVKRGWMRVVGRVSRWSLDSCWQF